MKKAKDNLVEFLEFLNRYLPVMSTKIPTNINAGGCAMFAMMLYQVLVLMEFQPKITAIFINENPSGGKPAAEREKAAWDKGDRDNAGPDHVLIQLIKDIYLDCTGLCNTAEVEWLHATEDWTLDQLKTFVNAGCWNDEFDKTVIPMIQKFVDDIPTEFTMYMNGKRYEYAELPTKVTKYTHDIRHQHAGGPDLSQLIAELEHSHE